MGDVEKIVAVRDGESVRGLIFVDEGYVTFLARCRRGEVGAWRRGWEGLGAYLFGGELFVECEDAFGLVSQTLV